MNKLVEGTESLFEGLGKCCGREALGVVVVANTYIGVSSNVFRLEFMQLANYTQA